MSNWKFKLWTQHNLVFVSLCDLVDINLDLGLGTDGFVYNTGNWSYEISAICYA